MSSTDDGNPIFIYLIDNTPPQYLELTIQSIKYVKRSVKNAHIGIISPPGGEDLTETVINRLKEINPKANTEDIHWIEGRKHFDDWDNTQRILDIELFAEEFDPIIFLDSDSVVLGDISPNIHEFLRSGKKFGFSNSYIHEYPTFNKNWSGNNFIPKTSFQLYRATSIDELLPVWKEQWKTWIEPYPFPAENKDPARFFKNSKITIGQYALSKALAELNPNFDEIVYEIPNHSLKVNGNFGLRAQKAKRKFLGAGSSFSNDGPATVTLKVKSAKLNESGDPYVAIKVGDWTRKTKTIHYTDEPVWDQEFVYENSSYNEANSINFTLWNNPEPEPIKSRSFGGAYAGPAQVTLDIVSGTIHSKHDVVGEDDPYVKVVIGGVEKKTNYVKDTNNPQWNETLTWDDVVSDDAHAITITVWDWDKFTKHDLIGTATLDLLPYNGNKQHVTVSLTDNGKEEAVIEIDAIVEPAEAPTPVATRSFAAPTEPTEVGTATLSLLDKKVTEPGSTPVSISLPIVDSDGEEKGTLEIDAEFLVPQIPEEEEDEEEQPKTRSFASPSDGSWAGSAKISIDVISGAVKDKHDVVGEDDPYVKIKIGAVEKQTTHIKNTNKPVWKQNLTFTDVTSADAKNITITLWDWDKFTKHDLIGTGTLNLLQFNGKKGHATVSVVDKGKEEGTIEIDVLVTPNV